MKIISIKRENNRKKTIKLDSVTFFLLGIYILIEAFKKLLTIDIPELSLPGIIIVCASIVIMPILLWQKYKVGKQINSLALIADSKETLVCSFLSLALILGFGGNYLFGFGQFAPIIGIIITLFLFKEGKEIFEELKEENE